MFTEKNNLRKSKDLLKYFYFYERFAKFNMGKYWK